MSSLQADTKVMLSYAILFLCLSILFLIGAFSVYVKTSKELYWVIGKGLFIICVALFVCCSVRYCLRIDGSGSDTDQTCGKCCCTSLAAEGKTTKDTWVDLVTESMPE